MVLFTPTDAAWPMIDPGNSNDAGRWPFASPPELPVVSLKSIIRGRAPVLVVRHEPHGDLWQFLGDRIPDRADGLLVSLASLLEHDPSIAELADLQPGWMACRRSTGDAWVRRPIESRSDLSKDGGTE